MKGRSEDHAHHIMIYQLNVYLMTILAQAVVLQQNTCVVAERLS
jgi:hypothetical protein